MELGIGQPKVGHYIEVEFASEFVIRGGYWIPKLVVKVGHAKVVVGLVKSGRRSWFMDCGNGNRQLWTLIGEPIGNIGKMGELISTPPIFKLCGPNNKLVYYTNSTHLISVHQPPSNIKCVI